MSTSISFFGSVSQQALLVTISSSNNATSLSFLINSIEKVPIPLWATWPQDRDWETEPKKDIDVDIYYEATGGIPMKLDTLGNMQVYTGAANFRPRASKVVFDRRLLLDGSSETITLTGVPFAKKVYPNSTVSIEKSGQNNADILLTPTITPSTATAVGIGINDEIAFKHKNDLVTRAKVVDHMDIVDYQGLPQLTNSSERITVNGGSATSVILRCWSWLGN